MPSAPGLKPKCCSGETIAAGEAAADGTEADSMAASRNEILVVRLNFSLFPADPVGGTRPYQGRGCFSSEIYHIPRHRLHQIREPEIN